MINITYDELFTFESIYRAHNKGRTCKRDKKPLVRFEMCMLSHLYELYFRLKSGKYKFGKYSAFVVYEPKMRQIQTLQYSDRIVQHVLCDDMLMPYFSRRAILDNCVCQIGKGTHFALRRFEKMLHGYISEHGTQGYFLKCDILKYFPSIPHDKLKEIFCGEIRDRRIRALLSGCIDSYHTNAEFLLKYGIEPLSDDPTRTERGLPIGNQTSQVFGMFYLNAVDRLIKEKLRVKVYSRYMDDFLIVHSDKDFLHFVLEQIVKATGKLGLKLNSKTQIFPLKNGVTYLGFRYFVTGTGKIVKTVKKATKKRMRSRARLLKMAYLQGRVDAERVNMTLASFRGHLKFARTYKIRKELMNKLSFIFKDKIMARL